MECLVCAAVGAKLGKRFPDCGSLIQHATKSLKTKKKAAHRGYGRSICCSLGWNADRLPSGGTRIESQPRVCIPTPDEKDQRRQIGGYSHRFNRGFADSDVQMGDRPNRRPDLEACLPDRAKYCRSGEDLSDLPRSRQKIGGNPPDPEIDLQMEERFNTRSDLEGCLQPAYAGNSYITDSGGSGTQSKLRQKAASEFGCLVVNAPTANIDAAAEPGIALIASLAQKVPQGDASMKAGARSDPDLHEASSVFQLQVNISGKTSMLWARATDLVQNLLQNLEGRLGIPSSCLRLIYKGKQLMTTLPLSFYSIQRDASIIATFRLRGGSFRQTSSAPSFSFKDAVHKDAGHSQPSSSAGHPFDAPRPFLVDKSEDIPSINLSHPGIDDRYQLYAEAALVCRFNGLWPRTSDLYQWIHTNWSKKSEIHLCSKGFFIVVFDRNEDYKKALTGGPWFWGSAGLFLTPWFPDFDPSTAVITKTPIWVRLPNLPVHLWHVSVFIAIAETLGRYLAVDSSRKENGLYTFGRICAEIDISKGLSD